MRAAWRGGCGVAQGREPPADGVEILLGVRLHRGLLSPPQQRALLAEVREVVRAAPLRQMRTPSGRQMSVAMTNAGEWGWTSDRRGYRYARHQPGGSAAWPPIPPLALDCWRQVADHKRPPQCCLVNFYGPGARLGLHRDEDEANLVAPVVSISLGDPARFRVGGLARSDPTRSTLLRSGDVAVLAGASRLAYHGVDSIRHGESDLLVEGGRLNLTLRVVDLPADPT